MRPYRESHLNPFPPPHHVRTPLTVHPQPRYNPHLHSPHHHSQVRGRHYCNAGHKLKGGKTPSPPPGCRLVHVLLIPTEAQASLTIPFPPYATQQLPHF